MSNPLGREHTGASASIGDRLILRGPIVASHWLGGDSEYEVAASATVVEVLGRSFRVRIDSVSGVPRRWRKEAAELMEGWHSFDTLKVKS